MSKLQGTELRRIRDTCILEYLYRTARLRVYCDVLRTTLCRKICKSNGVRNTLWERRCGKDVVRKTLWERRCEKDVVRKSLWKIYLFWPASFYWQIFVIKNVLHRLGALHLWGPMAIIFPILYILFHLYNIHQIHRMIELLEIDSKYIDLLTDNMFGKRCRMYMYLAW